MSVNERSKKHQEITIATIENPGFAYKNLEGRSKGFVYDVANEMNQLLPSRLKVTPVKVDQDTHTWAQKKSHSTLLFASFPESFREKLNLVRTKPFLKAHYLVVCSKDHVGTKINFVVAESSTEYEVAKKEFPQSTLYSHKLPVRDLLLKVWRNPEICTLIDEKLMAVFHIELPELRIKQRLSAVKEYAFYTHRSNTNFLMKLNAAYELDVKNITQIQDVYFGSVRNFDYADYQIFLERLEEDLSSYVRLFREVAQKYKIPWTLLAAVAYQESHWNPQAQSPTGVKGFMMLTESTARWMGVKNIYDLEDNLKGGAKYLKKIFDELPQSINDIDRPLFALAAYNAGQSIIQRVRIKTRTEGKNPDRWTDVAEVLPRLSEFSPPRTDLKSKALLPHGGLELTQATEASSQSNTARFRPFETLQFIQKVRFYEIFLKQREKAWQSNRQLTAQDDEPEN